MLSNLVIENIAVIEYASIDFSAGFNCLTGETGAGKSIIIDSINAVLGEKTSRELIRNGADRAKVSALFTDISPDALKALDDEGIEAEDGCVHIVRMLNRESKNTCKINGVGVSAAALKRIGLNLINIHGQSDSQQLMQPQLHCAFIDALADDYGLIADYRVYLDKLYEIKRAIKKLRMDESEKERRTDILRYQTDEIEKAAIEPDEFEALKARREVITNSKNIIEALFTAYAVIAGTDDTAGAERMVFDAANEVSSAAEYDKGLADCAAALNDAAYSLEDISSSLRSYIESLKFDPAELRQIEDRLDVIMTLRKKYGDSYDEITEFYNKAKAELDMIESSDEKITQLENEYDECYKIAVEKAEKLSDVRMKTARKFEKKIKGELETLDMPSVEFKVRRELCPFTKTGIDNIEFLISANAGEELKPLAKTASGGELSRIMLAIKSAMAGTDSVGTLIFDEIDTGVSGHAAGMIARKLYSLSSAHQVICITHLPVIAAFADTHFEISKTARDGRTYTDVHPLTYDGRKRAIARIIGGDAGDEVQISAAGHMLEEAQKYKEAGR